MFLSIVRRSLAVLAAVLSTGCALQAPPYQPNLDNVETAKKMRAPAAIGSFVVAAGGAGVTSISIRGSGMTSPIGADYAAYLASALQQELQLAGKLDAKSTVTISGTLLKNDIAAGGFSTNSGEIEAEFVVTSGGKEAYRGTKRAEATWDSSFIGSIAIPKAQQQYPGLVQKLIGQFLADAAFMAAVK